MLLFCNSIGPEERIPHEGKTSLQNPDFMLQQEEENDLLRSFTPSSSFSSSPSLLPLFDARSEQNSNDGTEKHYLFSLFPLFSSFSSSFSFFFLLFLSPLNAK